MSNLNYEAALKYIDLGSYDKAVEKLKLAIDEESSKDNDIRATEYRCVLGELYAQLGMEYEAREEFSEVIYFARENNVLDRQSKIAKAYLKAFDNILPYADIEDADDDKKTAKRIGDLPMIPKPVQNEGLLPPIPSANTEPANRPGDVPLVPKPVQNKGFISRQMNKKHR